MAQTAAADRHDASPLVRVGRQGIFDASGRLLGHELLFRGHATDEAAIPNAPLSSTGYNSSLEDHATSHVISATFGDFGVDDLGRGLPLYINMTRAFLTGALPMPFGPDGVVLEILENVPVDDDLLLSIQVLKEMGYTLAVDDFTGEPERIPLLEYADIVKLDLLSQNMDLPDLVGLVHTHAPHAAILAERVENEQVVRACVELGIDMFQGYHFQRPVVMETLRLSPSQIVCLRLTRTLNDPDSSMKDIEAVVALDPGLSLRVLRTANSASSATTRKIVSLRQAVVLLGPKMLSAWVMLTLLGGVGLSRRDDLVTILTRAHTAEILADRLHVDSSSAYTAGMISGVAHVLGSDITAVATPALVGEALSDALLHGVGPLGHLMAAVLSFEDDDDDPGADIGISPLDMSRAYLEAWAWAQSTVTGMLH